MAEPEAPATRTEHAEPAPRVVEILRSTYRVMARRGSHRLSLQDVADEAGVSKGLLLYHFKSKENLLVATMRWALQRTAERIRTGIEGAPDARAALRSLVEAVFVSPQLNRDFNLFYLDLVEHSARVQAFGALPGLLREEINGLYATIIERGVDEGTFDVTDPDAAASVMRAQIEGTFLQWMQDDDWRGTHARYRDDCHQALVRILGA